MDRERVSLEMQRYEPFVSKLSDDSLHALTMVLAEENERRGFTAAAQRRQDGTHEVTLQNLLMLGQIGRDAGIVQQHRFGGEPEPARARDPEPGPRDRRHQAMHGGRG